MLIRFVIILNLALISSCGENHNNCDYAYIICGVKNPKWFTDLIEEIENNSFYIGSVIYQHEYQSAFLFHLEIPLSSCAYCKIYDCDGTIVE